MTILVNALRGGQSLNAKNWLTRNGDKIKDKHIFYIVKPTDMCDKGNFKFGKSLNGYNRIRSYSNLFCGDVSIYYLEIFNKRDVNFSGSQPVDAFESLFSRNLKKLKVPFVRGREFVQASGRKMEECLEMTKSGNAPIHHPIRKSSREVVRKVPWYARF